MDPRTPPKQPQPTNADERSSVDDSLSRVQEYSVLDLIRTLLRNPRLFVGLPLAMFLVGFGFFKLSGSYKAVSTFEARQPLTGLSGLAGLAGLASQVGVNVSGALGGESVDFYAWLLQSDGLLADAVTTRYKVPKDSEARDSIQGTLIQIYGIHEDTPEKELGAAVKKLKGRASVTTDLRANLVTLTVKTPWPALSQAVNRRMLSLVNQFNLETRQTAAGAERRFIEARLDTARDSLRAAEDAMRQFLETNRTYQTSPRLTFEAARLQRVIDLRQQLYVTLSQAREQARMEEVRNTPVISVLLRPELMAGRSRNPFNMGILGAFAGMVLAVGLILFREYLARERQRDPEAFAELTGLARGAMERFRLRRVPRFGSGSQPPGV